MRLPRLRRTLATLATLGVLLPRPAAAQQPTNPVNLWIVDVRAVGSRVSLGTPRKLTGDRGINSQPAFTPDGRAIVFSGTRGEGPESRSDIYRLELASGAERQVTRTPENENSPTVNARGEYMAVRWVPATLFKEFGLWRYAPDGTPTTGVLPGPDTTGYYTPLPNGDVLLTRPRAPRFTLAYFDARRGTIVDLDSGVASLPAQRIPGAHAVSYVRFDSAGRHELRRLDLRTRRITSLGPTLVGRTAHVWLPDGRTVVMAKGDAIFARRAGRDTVWRQIARFADPALRHATAYVMHPRGTRLVLTSPRTLPLSVVLRDSLEAGRSGAEVAALIRETMRTGRSGDYVVAEGALVGLGDEWLRRRGAEHGVPLAEALTELLPASTRARELLTRARGTTP